MHEACPCAVYPYLANGSLEVLLQQQPAALQWRQRITIALQVCTTSSNTMKVLGLCTDG
jgi:hypothetical protein